MNTQTNVMEAIKASVEERGAAVIVDHDWANTGNIYAVMDGSLDAIGDVLRFNFQPDYIIFDRGAYGTTVVSWWRDGTVGTVKSLDALVAGVVDAIDPETALDTEQVRDLVFNGFTREGAAMSVAESHGEGDEYVERLLDAIKDEVLEGE